jgi:hypothetical protein
MDRLPKHHRTSRSTGICKSHPTSTALLSQSSESHTGRYRLIMMAAKYEESTNVKCLAFVTISDAVICGQNDAK